MLTDEKLRRAIQQSEKQTRHEFNTALAATKGLNTRGRTALMTEIEGLRVEIVQLKNRATAQDNLIATLIRSSTTKERPVTRRSTRNVRADPESDTPKEEMVHLPPLSFPLKHRFCFPSIPRILSTIRVSQLLPEHSGISESGKQFQSGKPSVSGHSQSGI